MIFGREYKRVAFEGGEVRLLCIMVEQIWLFWLEESMNVERYRNLCINEIISFARNFRNDLFLIHDNARPRRARFFQKSEQK